MGIPRLRVCTLVLARPFLDFMLTPVGVGEKRMNKKAVTALVGVAALVITDSILLGAGSAAVAWFIYEKPTK